MHEKSSKNSGKNRSNFWSKLWVKKSKNSGTFVLHLFSPKVFLEVQGDEVVLKNVVFSLCDLGLRLVQGTFKASHFPKYFATPKWLQMNYFPELSLWSTIRKARIARLIPLELFVDVMRMKSLQKNSFWCNDYESRLQEEVR